MYNYFVSGESQSYGYAQSTHDQFLAAEDPDAWYDRFQNRVGYVVITNRERVPATTSTYASLHEGLGVGANDTAATGHYQLLSTDDGVQTFAVVPGATIQVNGAAAEQVTARTSVSLANETYEYTRSATPTEGTATIQVAYPGEYRVGNQTVIVTNEDVFTGNQTTLELG